MIKHLALGKEVKVQKYEYEKGIDERRPNKGFCEGKSAANHQAYQYILQ